MADIREDKKKMDSSEETQKKEKGDSQTRSGERLSLGISVGMLFGVALGLSIPALGLGAGIALGCLGGVLVAMLGGKKKQ